jgi:hypothetical protein
VVESRWLEWAVARDKPTTKLRRVHIQFGMSDVQRFISRRHVCAELVQRLGYYFLQQLKNWSGGGLSGKLMFRLSASAKYSGHLATVPMSLTAALCAPTAPSHSRGTADVG